MILRNDAVSKYRAFSQYSISGVYFSTARKARLGGSKSNLSGLR